MEDIREKFRMFTVLTPGQLLHEIALNFRLTVQAEIGMDFGGRHRRSRFSQFPT